MATKKERRGGEMPALPSEAQMNEENNSDLVKWSPYKDNEGKQMISIAGAHWPTGVAFLISQQILLLLSEAK